jgi:hypothetical protein
MLDSGVLDVAIGVILVYFLLSFLGSAINEFIAARMRLRAKDLEDGIRLLLGSQTTTAPGAKDVAHLIRFWGNAIKGLWRVPMSLLFGSSNGSGKRSGGAAGELFNHPLLRTLKHNGKLPSYVPARTFSAALLDVERVARNPDLLWEAVSQQVARERQPGTQAISRCGPVAAANGCHPGVHRSAAGRRSEAADRGLPRQHGRSY